jgi:hypothetical protein
MIEGVPAAAQPDRLPVVLLFAEPFMLEVPFVVEVPLVLDVPFIFAVPLKFEVLFAPVPLGPPVDVEDP